MTPWSRSWSATSSSRARGCVKGKGARARTVGTVARQADGDLGDQILPALLQGAADATG